MRKLVARFSGSRRSERIRQWLVTGRTFAILSLCSMVFFLLLGVGGIVQRHTASSPVSSMKGFAAAVSSSLFAEMISMELPSFENDRPASTINGIQTAAFLMRLLTDINPQDPRSLVAGELPGMSSDQAFLLRGGSGTGTGVAPKDQVPIPVDPSEIPEPGQTIAPPETPPVQEPTESPEPADDGSIKPKRNTVFIYHTHNRESWYPELPEGTKDPSSADVNITHVGKHLGEKLEELGIGASVSMQDYPTTVPGYRWELLYKYSMKTVQDAMATNGDLTYLFDLHRDSNRRKHTTATIHGKDYAQVFFIIGHGNPDWKKNEAFATRIHEELEARYPGISRGIWGKSSANGNGEYNQSLSSTSALIEIGGVDNTLEESNRTADALAEVIADIIWEAERVDGTPAPAS
ncbi:stage II sporulation protein P [Paenibacillus daejeonensis]|uniref:stage II sporulation protein P n=1 Tax=Paenibacillus daejeonensis TaxID=135193 RepID=UPI0003626FF2|nr:stage II sporulation protein P [Paenibacillus daejeonensis]